MDKVLISSTSQSVSAPALTPSLRDRMSATLLDTAENAGAQIGEAAEEFTTGFFLGSF